jgi:hypothetical protein
MGPGFRRGDNKGWLPLEPYTSHSLPFRIAVARAILGVMPLAPKIGLSLGGLGLVAFGGALWAKYSELVWFDTLAAAFIGCFV